MKKFSFTTMIAVFLSLSINGIQAQTGTQAEKLYDALVAKDLKNALVLVQYVDSVNYTDKHDVSILMCASTSGYIEVCKILIDKGAKLNLQDTDGITALMQASFNG